MPQSKDELPVEWVSADIIRQYFNESQILERSELGELKEQIKRESHRLPPPKGEPSCTRSQIVVYYSEKGEFVALAHRYVRPDGTLGASGLPDPKRMRLKNKIIATRTKIERD